MTARSCCSKRISGATSVHVRDVARAFLHGMTNFDTMHDNVFNIGLSDANISKLELCERIQRHLPYFAFPLRAHR